MTSAESNPSKRPREPDPWPIIEWLAENMPRALELCPYKVALPDQNPRKRQDAGTRPFPHEHEGRGARCLACNEPRWMHPDGPPESNPRKRPEQRCRHGFVVNECPHPATVCNYSRDYEVARHVPPPDGAWIHPKVRDWMNRD